MMQLFSVENISRFVFVTAATVLVSYIIISNIAPFGATANFDSTTGVKDISALGPANRVSKVTANGETYYIQKDDLIYFSTRMPFHFDTAKVTVWYQNQSSDQNLFLGFHDQTDWHYDSQMIDAPLLNNLGWNTVGENPTLFERNQTYQSYDEFLNHPPHSYFGTYQYDPEFFSSSSFINIPDYSPATTQTVIDTPLRGKHTMYVYLKNEPFEMTIEKQDLNWYEGEDPMTVSVYKEKDLVYQATVDDDGITDSSHKLLPPLSVTIKNPGPGLPEDGVYKVVIDANSDTIIKSITTNLHKIVFESPVFPAGNPDVYTGVEATTSASILYTDAKQITAQTYHSQSFQTMIFGNTVLPITATGSATSEISDENPAEIIAPKSDVQIQGAGYFAFQKDQFFKPFQFFVQPVQTPDDALDLNYIVSPYSLPDHDGPWSVATRTYNLQTAVMQNGTLSWLLKAPNLSENGNQILIKKIQVEFLKKPIL